MIQTKKVFESVSKSLLVMEFKEQLGLNKRKEYNNNNRASRW
jgi:hypothetical protein